MLPRPRKPPITVMLRLANRRITTRMRQAVIDAGHPDLYVAFATVLPFVPPDGVSATALAEHASVTKQAMAQLLARLVEAGYVTRHPDTRDRRLQRILLTERGRTVQPVAYNAALEAEAEWARLIGEGRVELLRNLLVDLLEALDGRGVCEDHNAPGQTTRRRT